MPGVTWLPGSALYAVSAPAADGVDAAASAGPALLEADVTGPGILLFDWAGPALEVSLDGTMQRARADGSGAPFCTGAPLIPPAGFRSYPLEIPAGTHRLRIASSGMLFLDRCRLYAGSVPPAEAPAVTTDSFLLTGAVKPGRVLPSGFGVNPVTAFLRTANNAFAEAALPLAGPGVLGFRWDTDSTRATVLLDDRRLNSIYSGTLGPWDFVAEIPPGVHTLRLTLAAAYNQTTQFRCSDLTWVPGGLTYSSAAGSGVQWSSVGERWLPEGDRIAAGSSDYYLLAHFAGPALVQWREPFAASTALSAGGRQGLLFQRFAPFSGEQEIQWTGRSEAWVGGLTITPLAAVPLTDALDAGPGLNFSHPPGSDWTGFPVAGSGLTGDDAVFATAADAATGVPLEATVHGPGTLAFDWGLVAGMNSGRGVLRVNGLHTAETVWLRQGLAFTRQTCLVDLAPGPQRLAWTGSGFFLDHPRLLTAARRLATALDAPELQFSMTARDGSATEALLLADSGRDATGCVRLRARTDLSTSIPPDELRVAVPEYGILRWQERSDTAAAWQSRTLHVEAGSSHVFQNSSLIEPRWIDDISFTPADRYRELTEAVDAPFLPWEFSPGCRFEDTPAAAADGVDCLHIGSGERARVRLFGKGTLRLRLNPRTYDNRIEVNGQLFSQTPQINGWLLFSISLTQDQNYTVDIIAAAGGNILPLDTVEWLPSSLPPAGADAITDSDGDGVTALLEYAFGLDALTPDASAASLARHRGLPVPLLVQDSTGARFLEMLYVRRTDGRVTVVPEFSDTAETGWQPAAASGNERVSGPGCPFELWRVRDAVPVTPGQRRFGRLRVASVPPGP